MNFKEGDIIVFRNKYAQGCDLNAYNSMCKLPEIMNYARRQISENIGVDIEDYPIYYAEQERPFKIITVIPMKLTNFQDNLCLLQSKSDNKYYVLLWKCVLNYAIPYIEYKVGDIIDVSQSNREGLNQYIYDAYESWMNKYAYQYISNWTYGSEVSIDEHLRQFKIVLIAPHTDGMNRELFLIQSSLTNNCYIVDSSYIYGTPQIVKITPVNSWFD